MIRIRSMIFGSLLAASSVAASAEARELSLVSGFYRNDKFEPSDIKQTKMSVSTRYGETMGGSKNLMWYMDAGLELVSYSGDNEPDDGTGIMIGGGTRLFFDAIGERILPYIGAGGYYESTKGVSSEEGIPATEVETSGLYYYGTAGLRLVMGKLTEFDMDDVSVFLDFDLSLFKSPLFATTKSKDLGNPEAEEQETTQTHLFVGSEGILSSTSVGFGLMF